jgi:flagellin
MDMALTVNTNMSSLVTQRALGTSKGELDQAMERLASGKRINSAADDAAGLSISSRMEAQVASYRMAIRNAEDGISLAKTAEGAMEEITEMLQRMRELAMASANGTYSQADRASLDLEVQQLKEEIDRITMNSVFNGRSLLDGTYASVMQVGTQSSEAVTVNIANLTTDSLGGISGATVSDAVTRVAFKGLEAAPTISQLSFESNDDYTFVLKLSIPADSISSITDASTPLTLSYNIAASVVNGGAGNVVSAINQAIRSAPDHISYTDTATPGVLQGRSPLSTNAITSAVTAVADSFRISYVGKSVTVENLNGMDIAIEAGTVEQATGAATSPSVTGAVSRSGGSITFTSVAGGIGPNSALSETKVIGGSGARVTAFQNAGGGSAVTNPINTQTTLELGIFAATYGASAIDYANIGDDPTDRIHLVLSAGGEELSLDTGTISPTTDVDDLVAELNAALTTSGNTKYTVTNSLGAGNAGNILITRVDGLDFNVELGANHSLTTETLGRVTPELKDGGVEARSYADNGSSRIDLSFNDTQTAPVGADTGIAANKGFDFKLKDANGFTLNLETGIINGASAPTAAQIAAAMQTALTNAQATAYTVAVNSDAGAGANDISITRVDGVKFTFEITDGTDITAVNETAAPWELSTAQNLKADNGLGSQGSATSFEPRAIMYLDVIGRDTYRLKFNNDAGTPVVQANFTEVNYNGSTSSLESMAIEIESSLMTMTDQNGNPYDFDVTVEGDRIQIIEKNGKAFGISDFQSSSQGRVMVSNEFGQSPTGQTAAKLLDDTVYDTEAVTYAKQEPVRTDIKLSFSTEDVYSFTVSDGTATAVINPTVADPLDLSSFAASIRVALRQAGMDGSIDVKVIDADPDNINPLANSDSIQLVHRLGKEVSIRSFASEESGEMFAEATAKIDPRQISTGVTRVLNDDTGTTSKRVKDVTVTSETLASSSLEILDRAIEDINMERAFLGAIASRLQHTIDNLGNIATNTEAANSRIKDADYASESAKLAKSQVLQQAGTAMLAQANASSQTVLSLLQG